MKKDISYKEAIIELEAILKSFESGEADIDTLSAQVSRATELINCCREKLTKVEKDLQTEE